MASIPRRTDVLPRKTQTSNTVFRRDHPYLRGRGVGTRRGSCLLPGDEAAEQSLLGRRGQSGEGGLSETIRLDLPSPSELAFSRAADES